MTKKWYVVHTYSGHENKVKEHLEKSISANNLEEYFGEIIIPMHSVQVMRRGVKKIKRSKSFPSYIIISMDLNNETKFLVLNTPSVTHFLGVGEDPTPLTEQEVEDILVMQDEESGTIKQEVVYKYGDIVMVVDGPFKDFTGTVEEVNGEKGRLKVMVSIFGRPTPVDVDFLQVEPVKAK